MAEPHPDRDAGIFDAAVAELEDTFHRLGQQYRRRLARQAEAMCPGLSPSAMKAFLAIRRAEPVTPSTLAEALLLDRAQVSRVLRELTDQGLVHREPDPQDRRSTLLTATAEGRLRLARARGDGDGGLRADLAGWDLADVLALGSLLQRFVDAREDRLTR